MTDTPTPPTGPEHERLRADLAGYVLGGLTLPEQHAVEVHLAGCPACQAELAELDPLPVLLDLARPVGATPPTAAPVSTTAEPARAHAPTPVPAATDPTPAAVPALASPPRRRVLVGAVAAVALVVALLVGVVIGQPSSPSFSTPIALQAVDGASSSGTAALRVTDAGTVVRLDLTGLTTGDGTYFECLWTSNQGAQSAGTFRAAADGSVQVDLVTAARRYPGWTLEIVEHPAGAADGRAVLRAAA